MPEVILSGWKPGLQKVALTKLIQREADQSLRAAKNNVDRYLEGERVIIHTRSPEAAARLAHDAAELGAVIEVEATDRVPGSSSGRLS